MTSLKLPLLRIEHIKKCVKRDAEIRERIQQVRKRYEKNRSEKP